MVRVACKCGKGLKVADEHIGKKVRCPGCGAVLLVAATAEQTAGSPSQDSSKATSNRLPSEAVKVSSRQPSVMAMKREQSANDSSDPPRTDIQAKRGKVGRFIWLFVGLGLFGLLSVGLVCAAVVVWFLSSRNDSATAKKPQAVTRPAEPIVEEEPPAKTVRPMPKSKPKPNEKRAPKKKEKILPPPYVPAGFPPPLIRADAKLGIPQDLKKQKEKRQARLNWFLQSTLEAYDRVGVRNEKWDSDAREALRCYANYFGVSRYARSNDDLVGGYTHAKKAMMSGCKDPFIKLIQIQMSYVNVVIGDVGSQAKDAADKMTELGYPAIHTMRALVLAATETTKRGGANEKARIAISAGYLHEAINLIPRMLEESTPESIEEYIHLYGEIESGLLKRDPDRMLVAERILKPMERNNEAKPLQLYLRGSAQVKYAWDARGGGVASTVTPRSMELFTERLNMAELDLQLSYKLAPSFADEVACSMMQVILGLGGNRQTMELWFERAMSADGDCIRACNAKARYLEPKWYGSFEESREFCESCLAVRNLEGGLGFTYANVLLDGAIYDQDREAYFLRPEIWSKVKEIYDIHIKAYPKAKVLQGKLAKWANRCHQYEDAYRLFSHLGPDGWFDAFDDYPDYLSHKSLADKNATKAGLKKGE